MAEPKAPYTRADVEARLTPEQFHIAFEAGTERAFTGPYWNTKKDGVYHCVVCDTPLFDSADKFDSGTGWPSFTRPKTAQNVETSVDHDIGYARTEIHCATCGAHMGHLFPDGPHPTGLRYCINGTVLTFRDREGE